MTHTTNIINGTIEAVSASQLGALAGFEFRCECGETFRSSMESAIRMDAIDHTNYLARQGR